MKRFTNKQQIIDLIDRYRSEHGRLAVKAHDLDFLANRLVGTCEQGRAQGLRDKAEETRKQMSWRETRLKNLGNTLSELMTPNLPGTGITDESVPSS